MLLPEPISSSIEGAIAVASSPPRSCKQVRLVSGASPAVHGVAEELRSMPWHTGAPSTAGPPIAACVKGTGCLSGPHDTH